MNIYKDILRPILFQIGPETCHDFVMKSLDLSYKFGFKNDDCYKKEFNKEICKINFPNPIGLAAGFDKNGQHIDSLGLLGFGFIEVGTITPKPQSGSPRPRLFRIEKDQSLLNFMGFNNDGVKVINQRLEKRNNTNIILGANISKNKYTENVDAHKDIVECFNHLFDNVDYFTINVSSPNTPGLINLLDVDPLKKLFESVQNENQKHSKTKPIFLKISPDIDIEKLDGIINICLQTNISGIVATNTTNQHSFYRGGVSGNPLIEKSGKFIDIIKSITDKLVIISSGGVMSKEIAVQRLNSGADLVQLYTGLIYEGPNLPKKILQSLY